MCDIAHYKSVIGYDATHCPRRGAACDATDAVRDATDATRVTTQPLTQHASTVTPPSVEHGTR